MSQQTSAVENRKVPSMKRAKMTPGGVFFVCETKAWGMIALKKFVICPLAMLATATSASKRN